MCHNFFKSIYGFSGSPAKQSHARMSSPGTEILDRMQFVKEYQIICLNVSLQWRVN